MFQQSGSKHGRRTFGISCKDCYAREISRFVCNRLQLHGAIYRPHSFILMLRYCANLKAIRYESTNLNRIVADKSHRVIVAIMYDFLS